MMRRATLAAALTLALALGLATVALADDGGVMQRAMGHDAYGAMVEQMRGLLGSERADAMLAECEREMVEQAGIQHGGMGGMQEMMRRMSAR